MELGENPLPESAVGHARPVLLVPARCKHLYLARRLPSTLVIISQLVKQKRLNVLNYSLWKKYRTQEIMLYAIDLTASSASCVGSFACFWHI